MNPRIINAREAALTFPQGRSNVEVEESKTNYYVTIRPHGWVGAIVEFHKVSKRKAYNMLDAAMIAYHEYMEAGNKWNWK